MNYAEPDDRTRRVWSRFKFINITMFFQRENLSSGSLNFYPENGDIVDWNDYYWEINGTTEPKLFGGHPNFKHNIVATAHRSRLSSLQIEERPR